MIRKQLWFYLSAERLQITRSTFNHFKVNKNIAT